MTEIYPQTASFYNHFLIPSSKWVWGSAASSTPKQPAYNVQDYNVKLLYVEVKNSLKVNTYI